VPTLTMPQRRGGSARGTAALSLLEAAVCTFPDDTRSDPRCDGPDVYVAPVPIRLRDVFTFASERGARVSRAAASSAR